MLDLDSPRWLELHHAYGAASDIPDLLRQLATFPTSDGQSEPWFSIWSALAHQGDVYTASFAAVPHIVRVLSTAASIPDDSFYHLPAWIEICRQRNNVPIPDDLATAYFSALRALPRILTSFDGQWEEGPLRCALAAIAASNGNAPLAEVILELEPDLIDEFFEWYWNRS